MKNKGTHFLVQGAAIAAVYVVLTLVFAPLSFGEVQIRFSEALTVLPFFTPAAIPGLFVGCIIANLLGGAIPVDHFRKHCHTYRCILYLQASQYRQMDSPNPADRFQHCDRSSCASLRIWH